eukprot:981775-Pelagomonas_calceolata.AAC.2
MLRAAAWSDSDGDSDPSASCVAVSWRQMCSCGCVWEASVLIVHPAGIRLLCLSLLSHCQDIFLGLHKKCAPCWDSAAVFGLAQPLLRHLSVWRTCNLEP